MKLSALRGPTVTALGLFLLSLSLLPHTTVSHDHKKCGTHSPDAHAKNKDIADIAVWKERMAAKMTKLAADKTNSEHKRRLQDTLGPTCKQCEEVDMRSIVFRNPTIPGGFSTGVITEAILEDQFLLTNYHFRDSPFRFRNIETVFVDNEYYASVDYDKVEGSSEAATALYRQGGSDIANVIYADGVCFDAAGFASLPEDHGMYAEGTYSSSDHIFMCPNHVWKLDNDLGTTLAHELGHWMGLYHPFANYTDDNGNKFEGCDPRNLNDLVDDTAQMFNETDMDCPVGRDSCPNLPGLDPINNYMDYSNDACQTEFTRGQMDRMYAEFDLYRRDLAPFGCNPNTEAPIELAVTMNAIPTTKRWYVNRVSTSGEATRVGRLFSNSEISPKDAFKRFVGSTCVTIHNVYNLRLFSDDMPPTFAGYGSYVLSVKEREIFRDTRVDGGDMSRLFSPDVEDCGIRMLFAFMLEYDEYPEETTWELRNTDTNTVVVDQSLVVGNSTLHVERCLDPAWYTFTIGDTAKDGLDGSYRILLDGYDIRQSYEAFTISQVTTFSVASSPTAAPIVPTSLPTFPPTPLFTTVMPVTLTASPSETSPDTPMPIVADTPTPMMGMPVTPQPVEDDGNNAFMGKKTSESILASLRNNP